MKLVNIFFHRIWYIVRGGIRGVVANMLDCDTVVSEFKLQLCLSVEFSTNAFGKFIELLTLPEYLFYSSIKMALVLKKR